jgi:hypothetical protein
MKVQEAWNLIEGTIEGKIVWKQTLNQKGFACAQDGATDFEIVQEGEYLYKLTKFDSSHNPIDSLQNPEPLPGEFKTTGHHCDEHGQIKVPGGLNSAELGREFYILIRLYEAAKESGGTGTGPLSFSTGEKHIND